ncbi:hypothetical protein BDP81DRAFT_159779 [Colletotrichum phormii]|uniref:Uncharacterized protein n=1 Tax=Colletotrichum phormii TaxID=359342 RepID=A0AAI9ZYI3_9PEZI|nr:uncharacterized protein BDP81DRAFT_159779 [Colletotrichum phormii]KAK1640206.1 hypothetical protein BDP81DRAFT_159779 [Colletotrichum phormii]
MITSISILSDHFLPPLDTERAIHPIAITHIVCCQLLFEIATGTRIMITSCVRPESDHGAILVRIGGDATPHLLSNEPGRLVSHLSGSKWDSLLEQNEPDERNAAIICQIVEAPCNLLLGRSSVGVRRSRALGLGTSPPEMLFALPRSVNYLLPRGRSQ